MQWTIAGHRLTSSMCYEPCFDSPMEPNACRPARAIWHTHFWTVGATARYSSRLKHFPDILLAVSAIEVIWKVRSHHIGGNPALHICNGQSGFCRSDLSFSF